MTVHHPSPPAGWYPDPARPGWVRWFDGRAWTAHAQPSAPAQQWQGGAQPWQGGAQQWQVGAQAPSDELHWVLPVNRPWQSIAAGYVALFALLVWPLGPAALALGLAGLQASARTGRRGRGRAWFGVVVGASATCAMLVWAVRALAG